MQRVLSTVLLLAVTYAAWAAEPSPAEAVLSHEIVRATEEARRNGEASLVELKDGSLLLLYGAHSKPGDWDRGEIRQIRSRDGGKTWNRGHAADVLHVAENPHRANEWGFWEPALVEHAPGKLLMLAVLTRVPGSDTLVLIQNPEVDLKSGWHGGPRRVLAFRTSTNGGRTWSEPTDLYRVAEEKLWIDYPAVRWIDGNLHLVWRHSRQAATDRSATSLSHHVVPAAAFPTDRGAGGDEPAEVHRLADHPAGKHGRSRPGGAGLQLPHAAGHRSCQPRTDPEARAMFTQHDAMLASGLGRAPVHADSIAVTEWYMDAHGCTTARVPGSMDEGKAMLHQETFPGQLR